MIYPWYIYYELDPKSGPLQNSKLHLFDFRWSSHHPFLALTEASGWLGFRGCILGKTYWCVSRREWMGMGVAGIIIHSYYGSFPHSRSEAPVRKRADVINHPSFIVYALLLTLNFHHFCFQTYTRWDLSKNRATGSSSFSLFKWIFWGIISQVWDKHSKSIFSHIITGPKKDRLVFRDAIRDFHSTTMPRCPISLHIQVCQWCPSGKNKGAGSVYLYDHLPSD